MTIGVNVVFVGPQPPPVHGMAMVNKEVCRRLLGRGASLRVIDTSAAALDRSPIARLKRLPKIILGLWRFVWLPVNRADILYMSVSGGFGQIYECLFVLVARCKGLRVALHHHSFSYLDRHNVLTAFLLRVAGVRAMNVVLSEGMGQRLTTHYRCGQPPFVLSNAALLLPTQDPEVKERVVPKTIGFLGNLSAEKGVFIFLDVCDAIVRAKLQLRTRLAGPFQDAEAEERVHQRLTVLPTVEYVGPQYGEAKQMFYQSLDVLLFPTCYVNEAEPITIHEAMMRGVPVIANRRGCIGEVLRDDAGLVVDRPEDFVWKAVKQIETWLASPDQFQKASRAARERYLTLRNESAGRLESLLCEICNPGPTN